MKESENELRRKRTRTRIERETLNEYIPVAFKIISYVIYKFELARNRDIDTPFCVCIVFPKNATFRIDCRTRKGQVFGMMEVNIPELCSKSQFATYNTRILQVYLFSKCVFSG